LTVCGYRAARANRTQMIEEYLAPQAEWARNAGHRVSPVIDK
jgi:hypothetical protein